MPDSLLGGIVINEILADPNGAQNFDTDGNGTASSTDEFVELYNTSGSPIDISGLEFWDQGVGNWFTFPPGTILQPGARAMVMAGVQSGGSLPTGGPDDLFFDAGRGSPLINNGGDNVTLYDPANDAFIQATFNGDALDDPTTYAGFSPTATRSGSGEDFGNDADGRSVQRSGDGSDTFTTDTPTPGGANVCFADGTLLKGPLGEFAIEALTAGDMLVTADNGLQEVRWVFAQRWSEQELAQAPMLRPVRISRGALGRGLPHSDLLVSRQHRIVVSGPIAQRMFGAREVFVPAASLLQLEGVSVDTPTKPVTYFHVLLDAHEVLFAQGIAAESLHLGAAALETIPPAAIREVEALMRKPRQLLSQPLARPLAERQRAKRLVMRHGQNGKPLALSQP